MQERQFGSELVHINVRSDIILQQTRYQQACISDGLRQLIIHEKSVENCQQTRCKLILKTCFPSYAPGHIFKIFFLIVRCFKTHFWYAHCPKGAGKYILLYREPCAAFFSYFNFFKDWFFQPGEITLSEFVTRYLLKQDVPKTRMERASYFAHLVSWWERRYVFL